LFPNLKSLKSCDISNVCKHLKYRKTCDTQRIYSILAKCRLSQCICNADVTNP
jgi:hypothetical protein